MGYLCGPGAGCGPRGREAPCDAHQHGCQVDDLFRIVENLKRQGKAILFISHKFDEIFRIADDYVCLRDGEKVGEVSQGDEVEVILDVTPMYAESGGQMADRGRLVMGDTILNVNDVQRVGKKLWLHKATVQNGGLDLGSTVTAEVDGKGALIDLEFAYGANELGASRLAEQVVTTAALAAQKVYARIAAVTEEFNESFGDMLATRPAE